MKKKVILGFAVIGCIVLAFVAFVQVAGSKDFDVALSDHLKPTNDSAAIARGKYLVFGPAHCASCHTPLDQKDKIDAGLELPLTGGWELHIPPGEFRAGNLTPHPETGIGNISDAEFVRAMRYSVNHRNKPMFPFMPFQEMSDEDIVAILSYLRSQPAVENKVEPTSFSFLGKALIAMGAFKPAGPTAEPPKSVVIDTTVQYGEYVANRVANCVGCHTNRDLKTGEAIGEPFAGGLLMPPDPMSEGYAFVTPNITPDQETGIMATWSEEFFMERFKKGRIHSGSHMPWGSFSRMNETDLIAVYRYLKTLKPVKNEIAKIVFEPGEALPENH